MIKHYYALIMTCIISTSTHSLQVISVATGALRTLTPFLLPKKPETIIIAQQSTAFAQAKEQEY